jgi:hypothetical protein
VPFAFTLCHFCDCELNVDGSALIPSANKSNTSCLFWPLSICHKPNEKNNNEKNIKNIEIFLPGLKDFLFVISKKNTMFYNTHNMFLKAVIFIVIALILLSLVTSLFFLFKDQGSTQSKRTVYGLGTRVSLGILLIILVIYGLYTGQLGNTPPWEQLN